MSEPGAGPDSPPLRVRVPGRVGGTYPVHVGRGVLCRLGELAVARAPAHRYVIIADDRVAALYGDTAVGVLAATGRDVDLLTFPAGEVRKSRDTWTDLTDRMLARGAGRDAAVVALGGGVTGDLAGFVASTYMRGIPLIAVPTSLLAMLDSAIGGKTGLDAGTVKNAVGTFHHPRLVVVDPDLLGTLPAVHRTAGLAEALKAAAIADAALFEWIEANVSALRAGAPEELERLVAVCLRIKASVVEEDPEESGRRAILNFGHTAGHALEALSDFALPHGEAVAAGMRIEARLGEAAGVTRPGTASRLAAALDACGLPDARHVDGAETRFGGRVTAGRLLAAAAADKKARKGGLRWVLLHEIGSAAREARGGWSHGFAADGLTVLLDTALRDTADVRDSAS